MSPPLDHAALLLDYLPQLRRYVKRSCIARRIPNEIEDIASGVCVKLLERDGALIRQHRGQGSFDAYLARIVDRFVLDHQNREWGKWRPSATARQYGKAGMLLDQLMSRDHLPRDMAAAMTAARLNLVENRAKTIADEIWSARSRNNRSDGAVPVGTIDVEQHDHARRAELLDRALRVGLGRLAPIDRHLLERRFRDGLTVTDIASELGLDRKRLYRRYESVLARLRAFLIGRGVDRAMFSALLATRRYSFEDAFTSSRSLIDENLVA